VKSILFHHYKEILECRRQVEQLMMTCLVTLITMGSVVVQQANGQSKDFQNGTEEEEDDKVLNNCNPFPNR
jgi:hypothetical protein